jgi:hypothetical protein
VPRESAFARAAFRRQEARPLREHAEADRDERPEFVLRVHDYVDGVGSGSDRRDPCRDLEPTGSPRMEFCQQARVSFGGGRVPEVPPDFHSLGWSPTPVLSSERRARDTEDITHLPSSRLNGMTVQRTGDVHSSAGCLAEQLHVRAPSRRSQRGRACVPNLRCRSRSLAGRRHQKPGDEQGAVSHPSFRRGAEQIGSRAQVHPLEPSPSICRGPVPELAGRNGGRGVASKARSDSLLRKSTHNNGPSAKRNALVPIP